MIKRIKSKGGTKKRSTTKRKAVTPSTATVNITARLPGELHERLRDYAHVKRVSINSLIREGLEWVIKQKH